MPYVFGALREGGIRICSECGDVSLEDEAHWHPERKDPMAANKDALIAVLDREGIEYRELQNDSGWMLEVISPVEGGEMERVLRTIDTQTNVQAIIIPNIGLSIQTSGFDEQSIGPMSDAEIEALQEAESEEAEIS